MADVKNHTALPRRHDLWSHAATRMRGCVGERPETVGQDVAFAQARHHLQARRWWVVQVSHQGQPGGFGYLQRHVHRGNACVTTGPPADPDLDADHQIGVFSGNPDALLEIEQAQIFRLTHHHRV